jgi:hypothetical protein
MAGGLTVALVATSLMAGTMSYKFLLASKESRSLQEQAGRVAQRRATLNAFAGEVNEYARTNPAIEPLLERLNLRLRPATNSSPTRP